MLPHFRKILAAAVCSLCSAAAFSADWVEPRTQNPAGDYVVTVDACSGKFDMALAEELARSRIKATVFVTGVFLDKNPQAAAWLRSRPDIFQLANHGASHKAAVFAPKGPYGLKTVADAKGLDQEAQSVQDRLASFPNTARAFRGAGAVYSKAALAELDRLGLQTGSFTIAPDAGGTQAPAAVERALSSAKPGSVILLHATRPGSGLAQADIRGLASLQNQNARFVWWSEAFGEPAPKTAKP